MQKSFPRRNRDQIDNMDSTLAKFPNIGLRVCKELYDRSLSNLEKNSSTQYDEPDLNKSQKTRPKTPTASRSYHTGLESP